MIHEDSTVEDSTVVDEDPWQLMNGPMRRVEQAENPEMMSYYCPITRQPMKNPVKAANGVTYERESIQRWFLQYQDTEGGIPSPADPQVRLESTDLVPDDDMRLEIQRFVAEYMRHTASCAEETKNVSTVEAEFEEHDDAGRLEEIERETVVAIEELSKVLKKLDPLREILLERLNGLKPLQIVVVGVEKSGKSSLLERIAGIPWSPKSEELCTRLPIHLLLRCTAQHERGSATITVKSVTISEDGARQEGVVVDSKEMPLDEGYRFVQEEMTLLLKDESLAFRSDRFIELKVNHPDVPTIDLVDLPGINLTEARTKEIFDDICKTDLRQNTKNLYLATTKNNTRQNGDLVLGLLREKRLLDRTIGVITHADEIVGTSSQKNLGEITKIGGPEPANLTEEDIEQRKKRIRELGVVPVGHGWVVTMNREFDRAANCRNNFVRLGRQAKQEIEFFRDHSTFSQLLEEKAATTGSLILRLNQIYLQHLKQVWARDTFARILEELDQSEFANALLRKKGEDAKTITDGAKEEVIKRYDAHSPAIYKKLSKKVLVDLRRRALEILTPLHNSQHPSTDLTTFLASTATTLLDGPIIEARSNLIAIVGAEVPKLLEADAVAEDEDEAKSSSSGYFRLVAKFGDRVYRKIIGDPVPKKTIIKNPPFQLVRFPHYRHNVVTAAVRAFEQRATTLGDRTKKFVDDVFNPCVPQDLLHCHPDDDCANVKLTVMYEAIADTLITLFICAIPGHDIIKSAVAGIEVDEEESCAKERLRLEKTITDLKHALADIRIAFDLTDDDAFMTLPAPP